MYLKNPEETQVIVGFMNIYNYIWHSQESNSQPVTSQGCVDSTWPQWLQNILYSFGRKIHIYRINQSISFIA